MDPRVTWSLILIVLLLLMAGAIAWLRRGMAAQDQSPTRGFTLGDLRELHRTGKMTDAEFEAAKGLILQDLKQAKTPEKQNRTSNPPKAP